MKEEVLNVFDSEKELLESYPKKCHWYLKDIFNDYWYDFLDFADKHNLTIRTVVHEEVHKMLFCKTKDAGYSLFECPNCGKSMYVYNTCKGRFCNSCGVKYAKQRITEIMSKLLDVPHRHLVFTMPDILWNYFRENRSLLSIPFQAVSS